MLFSGDEGEKGAVGGNFSIEIQVLERASV